MCFKKNELGFIEKEFNVRKMSGEKMAISLESIRVTYIIKTAITYGKKNF